MPWAPPRPCLESGCPLVTTKGTRCDEHRKAKERQRIRYRGKTAARGYGAVWQAAAGKAIAEQPWCSYCLTPGDPSNPLTGDHIVRRRDGGPGTAENIRVACRRCNSRRQ